EIAVGRRVRELHRRGDAELREAADILRREELRVLDALAQAAGLQSARVSSNASSASRFAWSPIACTATGKPARAARRMTSANASRLVISTPEPSSMRAVCEPSVPSMKTLR